MNKKNLSINSILAVFMLGSLLMLMSACSLTGKMLPNAEFNTLMVDADKAIHDGLWEVALNKLEQAAVLKPDNLNVKLKQGLTYQLSGKLALAHNAYQQIIDTAPNATGRNAEIIRTAKTNQARLGFASVAALPQDPVTGAPESAEPAAETVASIEPGVTTTAYSDNEATVITEEIPAIVLEVDQEQTISTSVLEQEDVEALIANRIQAWSAAWQEKRLADYLSFYTADFSGDGVSSKRWREQRSKSIQGAKDIDIQLSGLKIEQRDNESVLATFKQVYRSVSYTDTGLKTLLFRRAGSDWLIVEEQFRKQR